MNEWFAEARKELLLFVDEKDFVGVILIPVILVFFVGYAVQGLVVSDARYTLPVVNQDKSSSRSQDLITALRADGVSVVEQSGEPSMSEDPASLLAGGKRLAVLVIPGGFADAVDSGQQVELPIFVDPSQASRAGLMLLAVQRTLYRFAAPSAAARIVARAAMVPETSVQSEVMGDVQALLDHPPVTVEDKPATAAKTLPNGFDQSVPGIALMWSLAFMGYAALAATFERRRFNTWARSRTTAATRMSLIGGKFAANYIIVALQIGLLFVIGKLVFGMHLGEPIAIPVVLAVFALVPASLGVLVAATGSNYQLVTIVSNIGVFVVGAISGAFVPLYLLPGWLERIAVVSPLYWGLSAVQDVAIRGSNLQDVLPALVVLCAFATGIVTLSVLYAERSAS